MSDLPRVTIAASGNWLLGHDRIGPLVLKKIPDRYSSDVELCDLGSSPLALLDHLRAQELLLVIDSCVGRAKPGEILILEPDLDQNPSPGTSVHQIGPLETLVIASLLYPDTLPRQCKLVLVETSDLLEIDEAQACEKVVEILDREVGSLSQLGTGGTGFPNMRGGVRGSANRT